ncbi:MAG: curved DNA-binding protein [Granulosicoccus sp.]|jgi:curved DNA-binding protein
MEFVDYYKVMDVAEDASAEKIKHSYRKLARKYHPDVSKEANGEEQFKKVAEAYQVLKDPERRKKYDELRQYGAGSGRGFSPPPGWHSQAGFDPGDFSGTGPEPGEFSDFFEELFGQRAHSQRSHHAESNYAARGQDVHSRLEITLHDAFNGVSLPVGINRPTIHSDGSIRSKIRTVNIKIPKGVVNGQTIRLRGQGGSAIGDAPAGNLYIELTIADSNMFHLHDRDVTTTLLLTPWEAALGANIVVPTLAGKVNLTIPPNTANGHKLRMKGRGMSGESPGDQYVVLTIVAPSVDTEAQKQLYRDMSELWSFNPRENTGNRND